MTATLVTGGAGYLGSALVPALAGTGRRIVVVDPLMYGQAPPAWESPQVTLLVRPAGELSPDDLRGVDEVIDLAGVSNESIAEQLPALTWATNCAGRHRTARLAAAAGATRYILASSSNVYGPRPLPNAEGDPTDPRSAYTRANAAAETAVLALTSESFHPLVLRQATVYGYATTMRYDLVVNAIVADAILTGGCRVMGDGRQVRPFIWITDLVDAYLAILERPAAEFGGRVLNLGSTTDHFAVGDIPDMLGELLGHPVPYTYYGELDTLSHRLDCREVERVLARPLGPSFRTAAAELVERIRQDREHVALACEQRSGFLARARQ
jgi:nucleoside-diphosphate-sugar epimerase